MVAFWVLRACKPESSAEKVFIVGLYKWSSMDE